MAGTPVGAPKTPTFPASSPQSDQAGSSSSFQPFRTSPVDSLEFTLKAGLVHRLLEHVIDVSDGVAAWLEAGERKPPSPPPPEAPAVPPWITQAQDTALRGLCIASLELIGDQATRLSGWVSDQQMHRPEFGVMPPRRRSPRGALNR